MAPVSSRRIFPHARRAAGAFAIACGLVFSAPLHAAAALSVADAAPQPSDTAYRQLVDAARRWWASRSERFRMRAATRCSARNATDPAS